MLRIGLVGAGVIARDHLATFAHLEGARLTAVADVDIDRARALTAAGGGTAHDDFRSLVGNVDAVWLCTPPAMHAAQALELAAAGIHVFCEKPLATDLESADRMIAACRASSVHLMVGHVIRYYPETIRLKAMVESGDFGAPVFAFGRRLIASAPRPLSPWTRDPAISGGFALESGCHEVDTVRFLGGEVRTIFARVRYDDPENPAYDTDYRALMTLEGGGGAEIAESCFSGMKQWVWGVTCSEATVISRRRGEVSVARMGAEEAIEPVAPVVRADGVNAAMLAENQAFVDAVAADRPPPIPGEEGRRAVEVILAGHRSAREGRAIDL